MTENKLQTFRQSIDQIDDKLVALFKERSDIVRQVGAWKAVSGNAPCPVRSAREAEMVLRMMHKFEQNGLPKFAAANLWRNIIGMSTSLEKELSIACFSEGSNQSCYWLAREYFGNYLRISTHSAINRVVGEVLDGKVLIGVVPMINNDSQSWWQSLTDIAENSLKVFAYLPFVEITQGLVQPCLVFAKLEPEASGNDITLLSLSTEHQMSQSRLQTAFLQQKLEATWLYSSPPEAAIREHIVSVKGFYKPDDTILTAFSNMLGTALIRCATLGAYAAPQHITHKAML